MPKQVNNTENTNTLAIVGLILSFLLPLVGLIISIIALSQINKSGEKGRGLAIAGIVVSSLWMVVGLLFFVLAMLVAVGNFNSLY